MKTLMSLKSLKSLKTLKPPNIPNDFNDPNDFKVFNVIKDSDTRPSLQTTQKTSSRYRKDGRGLHYT